MVRPLARPLLRDPPSLLHSMENMQGSCGNWRNKLLGKGVKVVMTFSPLIKPSFIMLHSLSERIWLLLSMHCWGKHLCPLHLLHLPGHLQQESIHLWPHLPGQNPNGPHGKKGGILCQSHGGASLLMELPQRPCRRDHPVPRDGRPPPGLSLSNPVMQRPSAETLTL